MFKSKRQKEAEAATESARLKRQSEQLREDFLNSHLNNMQSQSSRSNSSLPEESSPSEANDLSDLSNSVHSNPNSKIPSMPRQMNQCADDQTCIQRNSKNWVAFGLDFQDNPNEGENTSEGRKGHGVGILATQNIHRREQKNKEATQSKFAQSSLEAINYKNMLKNQIRKSKKLEQQLSKHKQKGNYMAQLIDKLKQQNSLLHKMLKKQQQKNQMHLEEKTKAKFNESKRRAKYCECDEQKTPSSLNLNKYSKLCQSSKLLK